MQRIVHREVAAGALGMRSAVRGEHCNTPLSDPLTEQTFHCSRQLYHPGLHAAHETREHPVDPTDTVEVIEVAWEEVAELVDTGEFIGWEVGGNVLRDALV